MDNVVQMEVNFSFYKANILYERWDRHEISPKYCLWIFRFKLRKLDLRSSEK